MKSVRVGIIDSGVHIGHPHVGTVVGGVAFDAGGVESGDYIDRIGHGTAVAAAIREKAPDAELFAVKIFGGRLSAGIEALLAAIRWCVEHEMRWINLSLGTANPEHEAALCGVLTEAHARRCEIVSAAEQDDVRWLPGSLAGTIGVLLDWDCPRGEMRVEERDGRSYYRASGYPRPIPGVPPERNLKGVSFAVANVTGLLANKNGRPE